MRKYEKWLTKDLLDSFMNHNSDGIVIVDLNGRVLEVNPAFESLHGWTREEVIGKYLPMTPPHLMDEARELHKKVLAGQKVTGIETFKLKKDGSSFHVSVTISPVKDSTGAVVAMVGVERDITEQKNAERKLQESEERYRQLVELSPEPIIVYSDFKIIYVNPSAISMIGATNAEELMDRPVFEFVHPDYLNELSSQVEQLLNGGAPTELIHKKFIRLDGRVIDVEVTAVPITYLGKRSVQLLCRDITDKKKAEEVLLDRERQYRRVLKLSPEPIVFHRDQEVVYINDSALKLFGAERVNQVAGHSIYEFIHPAFKEITKQRLKNVILSDEQSEFTEIKLNGLDGSVKDVEFSSIYVHKYVDYPIIQTVLRDLTERKRMEEYIRKTETLSVVGQLAAGIAHEIRNPLTSLKGFSQLLKSKSKENHDYIDIMLTELDRINLIVNEFLLIAKPHDIHFQKESLVDIVNHVVILLESQANLSNVRFVMKLESDDIPYVRCDQNQLKQVFVNVIKNAIEAVSSGGVVEIAFLHLKEQQRVLVIVKDNGCGIPEQKLSRLGEPFFTLKENGTGLGLTVCYRIIEAHQGRMSIDSILGSGTTVEIEVPIWNESSENLTA